MHLQTHHNIKRAEHSIGMKSWWKMPFSFDFLASEVWEHPHWERKLYLIEFVCVEWTLQLTTPFFVLVSALMQTKCIGWPWLLKMWNGNFLPIALMSICPDGSSGGGPGCFICSMFHLEQQFLTLQWSVQLGGDVQILQSLGGGHDFRQSPLPVCNAFWQPAEKGSFILLTWPWG